MIIKIRNKAIDNVCNKRKLSDGQIERTWLQDDFDIEFARLIIEDCANIAKILVMDISNYRDAEFVEKDIKEYFGISYD